MGNFTLTIKKYYKFDGDHITVVMRRLSRVNALLITPHINKIASADVEGDNATMAPETAMEYMEAAGKVLRESIVSIDGMFIEGQEVKPDNKLLDTVLDSIYFLNFIMDVTNDLVSESFMRESDEKKSEEQQQGALKE